jgi:GDP-D-mannose dehydratase
MSFALALKLPIDESKELLRKAGYAFSKSDKTDIIVEYCIENHIYDIFRVNEILYTYEQPVLGSRCY